MSEIDNIVIGGSNKELPIHQLNKLREDNSGRDNIFPLTLLQAIYDKTGIRLDSIISSFNYIFVPYAGTKEDTRLKVLNIYRRKGLVICYKDFEDNIIIEMYKDNGRNDDDWKSDNNWIDFKDFIESIVNTNLGDYVTDIKVEDNKLQFKSQGNESYSVIFDFKTIFDNIDNVAQTLTKNINSAKEELNDSINDTKEELINNINDTKEELTKSVGEVSSELNNYKTSNDKVITGINEKIESVNKDINDINESIDTTNEEITTIKDNVDNISNKVDGLDNTVKTDGTSTQYLGGDGKYHNILEYDDVIDVYTVYESSPVGDITNVHLYEDSAHQTEITTGNPKTIYQDITTDSPGYQFKWSGSKFIKVGGSSLVLGTTEGTAFEGNAGKEIKDLTDSLPSSILTSISFNGNYEDKVEVVYHSTSKYDPSSEPNYGSNSEVRVEFPIATPNTSGAITAADKASIDCIPFIINADVLEGFNDNATSGNVTDENLHQQLQDAIFTVDKQHRPIFLISAPYYNRNYQCIYSGVDTYGNRIWMTFMYWESSDQQFTEYNKLKVFNLFVGKTYWYVKSIELPLTNEGNGIKFLSDDGSYKEINSYLTVDYNIIQNDNYTLSDEDYNNIVISCQSGIPLIALYKQTGPGVGPKTCVLSASATGNFSVLYVTAIGGLNADSLINIEIGTDKISHIVSKLQLFTNGDGSAYLSDDGTYKTINTNDTIVYIEDGNLEGPMPIITETEFNGLISAKNGEGVKVLYRGDTYNNNVVKEIFGITYNDATVDFYILSNDHIVRFKADKTNNGNDTHNITKDIIPLPTEKGDGTKFLADNGIYKTIDVNNSVVFLTEEDFENGEAEYITEAGLEKINNAIQNLNPIAILSTYDIIFINRYAKDGGNIYLNCCMLLPTLIEHNIEIIGFVINTSTRKITRESLEFKLLNNGDGNRFLADNGEYVEVNTDSDIVKIDASELNNLENGSIGSETYEKLLSAISNKKQIIIVQESEYGNGVTPLQTAMTSDGVINAAVNSFGVNVIIVIEPSLTITVVSVDNNNLIYQFDLNKLISTDDSYIISAEDYNNLNAAINNKSVIQIIDTSDNLAVKKVIGYACYYLYNSQVNIPKGSIILSYVRQNASGGGLSAVFLEQIYIKYELDADAHSVTIKSNTLYDYNGDGTKYLSNNGTYKTINPQSFTLSQTYVPASDKFIPNYPAANDTYEGAIAKLHNMINKLQTRVTELETALTAKEVNDSQEEPLG